MKFKIQIVTCIFLVFFGCKNESKEEDLKQINTLKKKILTNNTILKEQEETIKKLEESAGIEKKQLKAIQHQRDSIIKINALNNTIEVFSTTNVFSDFYDDIDYEVTPTDTHWKRGVYYASPNSNEYLFNVKTNIVDNQIYFYFIGVEFPLEKEKVIATIYELNEDKEFYIIDKIDISPGIKIDRQDDTKGEWHLREFTLLQLDNLILKNNKLFYFKIKEVNDSSHHLKVSEKEYFEYDIGSKKKSRKINRTVVSNVIVSYADDISLVNQDKSRLVTNYGETMIFYEIQDWEKYKKPILLGEYFGDELKEIDFNLSKYFKETEDELYEDKDTGKDVLFGGMCWHPKKNILYFDNSGMTFRCIWEIDFDNDKVTKIVPEHEAIQPYFFETYNKEYIAYVEKNRIMLCEPPSNNN